MKNLDNSLEMIHSILESLIDISHNCSAFQEKEELMKNIDNLENVQGILYNVKNDFQKFVS